MNVGIKVWNRLFSILLYADDMVFVACWNDNLVQQVETDSEQVNMTYGPFQGK